MLDNWFAEPSEASMAKEPYEGPDYYGFVTAWMDSPDVQEFVTKITKEIHEVGRAGIPKEERGKVNRTIDAAVNRATQSCNNDPKVLACFVMGMLSQALEERTQASTTAEMLTGTLPEILDQLRKRLNLED